MAKPRIGITMGDPAGIGPEIIVKALSKKELYQEILPVVFGNLDSMIDVFKFISSSLELNPINSLKEAKGRFGTIDLMNFSNIDLSDYKYGQINAKAGKASVEYVMKAIDMAKSEKIKAVVTGPIHKEAIAAAGYNYPGHTEIFAEKTDTKNYAMMLADKNMKVIHVSTHVSLRKACDLVKKERIFNVIKLADQAVKELGVSSPRIGVAGLNPHSGEKGLFGSEEMDEIRPAIEQAREENINVEGPISPDTIFPKVRGDQYDIAVVMYHDQGHIPMKVIGFEYDNTSDRWTSVSGVNTTIGLPFIRTSVDHGTAFDKAGKGHANEESMVEAIKMAANFIK